MNPQPPRGPPPPPRKPAAARPAGSGRNSHVKNLSGELNEAMRPAREPPAEEMAKLNIKRMATGGQINPSTYPGRHLYFYNGSFHLEPSPAPASMAVGGTVPGIMLRKPTSHGMAGVTSFMPHYKGMSHSFNPTNQNFAQATFAQGGYFAGADHVLI